MDESTANAPAADSQQQRHPSRQPGPRPLADLIAAAARRLPEPEPSSFADEFDYPDNAVYWRNIAQKILDSSRVFFDGDRNAFRKGFLLQEDGSSLQFDNSLDTSSLYGPMMFLPANVVGKELDATAKTIEDTLLDKTPIGGTPRYEHDKYFTINPAYQGNPWHVTTLWMAQYYIRKHQLDRAHHYIDWSISHALQSGMLSEQVNPDTGFVVGITPLVWSHAELVNTILDLTKVKP